MEPFGKHRRGDRRTPEAVHFGFASTAERRWRFAAEGSTGVRNFGPTLSKTGSNGCTKGLKNEWLKLPRIKYAAPKTGTR